MGTTETIGIWVQVVALMGVFGLGMCFSLLGSISVKLMPRLNIDQGKFGTMISAFMFTCLGASLIMGYAVDMIGYKWVAVFGFIATAICIFIFAQSKSFGVAIIPCLLLGFGAMALNTAGNTLIPKVLFGGDPDAQAAALNFGNVFFGLGLFLTPLIVSFLFRKTTYEKAVSVLGIIILIPAIFAFIAKYPASEAGFSFSAAIAVVKVPAVIFAALCLFCYIALEASFCNWLAPYGKEVISKDFPSLDAATVDARSQQMLSAFAIAMMGGRLIASQIANITAFGPWYIAGAAFIAGLIILAMGKSGAIWTSALAVAAGLVFAPVFPTVVGVTFSKYSETPGSVFGVIFAIGLAGAVIVPKAMGNWAKGSSIQKSMKLLLPACVLLILFAWLLAKM